MFFETLKGEVYEFHTPKYIELSNEEYIDGGNKIVKDVFATSNNGSKEVYYVEINSNGEKVFISEEVYYKLEKVVQESIEDILIENHHLYDNEDYKLYNIAQRKMDDFPASYEDERDYYYYECEESANYIYSCDIIKFTYDWLEDNNIKKLKKEIKELKQQLENTENKSKYEEDYCVTTQSITKNNKEYNVVEIEDIEYIDLFKKIKVKLFDASYKYKIGIFKIGDEYLTPEYIKNMINHKQIPTYRGFPFRSLQDLYMIKLNYEYYFQSDRNFSDNSYDNLIFKKINNKFEITDIYGNKKTFKIINKELSQKFRVFDPEIKAELYSPIPYLTINHKEIKNENDFIRSVKLSYYKDKIKLNTLLKEIKHD